MTAYVPAKGDWAVITGAGRGIGRWLAQHFAAKDMRICALDIDAYEAEETARLCGPESRAHGCDVSDREETKRVATKLIAMGVEPSLLWINAGVGTAQTVSGAKPQALEWLMGVNVLGPVYTAQAWLPTMKSVSGNRHVGITASSASVTPVSGPFTLYATTKQMTAAIGEALTAELAEDGIGVTILCPGILNTEIWNAAQARPERFGGVRETPDNVGDHWRAQPGPEILEHGLDTALANGGGWCIIPTEADTADKMKARHADQRSGLFDYAVQPKGSD
ncbi:SDR family NAD(P)-dependent oxidoreductase [Erythrobacter crassostreae]|uniref:SDR family NAD(P)-dependent oxidoreductase n=1 Tax=Erythrobacter crassostreae TaxID=2828328 RepID=A0A9X1F526_9SPHN|nr:SDR family NAD(P)-dependent oxidoreductase [Erythrobacter crassostrea]MBV7260106.1 SDR family NAD(P)-dependent oxidoreductase [Erythrobacter crassostrea]